MPSKEELDLFLTKSLETTLSVADLASLADFNATDSVESTTTFAKILANSAAVRPNEVNDHAARHDQVRKMLTVPLLRTLVLPHDAPSPSDRRPVEASCAFACVYALWTRQGRRVPDEIFDVLVKNALPLKHSDDFLVWTLGAELQRLPPQDVSDVFALSDLDFVLSYALNTDSIAMYVRIAIDAVLVKAEDADGWRVEDDDLVTKAVRTTLFDADGVFATAMADDVELYEATRFQLLAALTASDERAKNAVRMLGGVPVVLNACKTELTSPLRREWALVVVRNICLNNLENQAEIASYEKIGQKTHPKVQSSSS